MISDRIRFRGGELTMGTRVDITRCDERAGMESQTSQANKAAGRAIMWSAMFRVSIGKLFYFIYYLSIQVQPVIVAGAEAALTAGTTGEPGTALSDRKHPPRLSRV
jgi:hypothetical protein